MIQINDSTVEIAIRVIAAQMARSEEDVARLMLRFAAQRGLELTNSPNWTVLLSQFESAGDGGDA